MVVVRGQVGQRQVDAAGAGGRRVRARHRARCSCSGGSHGSTCRGRSWRSSRKCWRCRPSCRSTRTSPTAASGRIRRRCARSMEPLDVVELAGRTIGEVSMGQQQRAAVARAAVADPKVLLADEPTSFQDDAHTESSSRRCGRRPIAARPCSWRPTTTGSPTPPIESSSSGHPLSVCSHGWRWWRPRRVDRLVRDRDQSNARAPEYPELSATKLVWRSVGEPGGTTQRAAHGDLPTGAGRRTSTRSRGWTATRDRGCRPRLARRDDRAWPPAGRGGHAATGRRAGGRRSCSRPGTAGLAVCEYRRRRTPGRTTR